MCTYSMIASDYLGRWPSKYPDLIPGPYTPGPEIPGTLPYNIPNELPSTVSKEEFDKLKLELEELKLLIKAAKRFDKATNQCDCEQEDKVDLIKKIAKLVGVDMSELDKK